ncbi:hypothetical protein MTBSS4_740006 [Magnetospirillum sp. SS-4]|nr:hypothetical protein MTBSS4_740006 [Magnetospirillum sp. SS-4]
MKPSNFLLVQFVGRGRRWDIGFDKPNEINALQSVTSSLYHDDFLCDIAASHAPGSI